MSATPYCPGSLKAGFSTYCPAVLRNIFNGKKVSHVLPEMPVGDNWEKARLTGNHFGKQHWYRLNQVKNKLVPDPLGSFLLKTAFQVDSGLRFHMEQAANEHVCMQIAEQVFGLETVPNALIFFPDGQPAIIYKYHPVLDSYMDFESLYRQISEKPLIFFQELSGVIHNRVAAVVPAMEILFRQIVCSWIMTNSSGHMKNRGLVKTSRGDLVIAPLSEVMCTRLHLLTSELDYPGRLYNGDTDSVEFRENAQYSGTEFTGLGRRMGISPGRIQKMLDNFTMKTEMVKQLINRSFLPDEAKKIIQHHLLERMKCLK